MLIHEIKDSFYIGFQCSNKKQAFYHDIIVRIHCVRFCIKELYSLVIDKIKSILNVFDLILLTISFCILFASL